MEKYLEAGLIVNTHGVNGEVKIQPWADSPAFLTCFDRFYIDGSPVGVLRARVHKSNVIATLEGVTDIEGAIRLKNKKVFIDRDDAALGQGRYFVQDLIGMRAIDDRTGADLGSVSDVLTLPSNDVYIITRPVDPLSGSGDKREMLVPAVPEFIVETNVEEGYVRIHMIEGLT